MMKPFWVPGSNFTGKFVALNTAALENVRFYPAARQWLWPEHTLELWFILACSLFSGISILSFIVDFFRNASALKKHAPLLSVGLLLSIKYLFILGLPPVFVYHTSPSCMLEESYFDLSSSLCASFFFPWRFLCDAVISGIIFMTILKERFMGGAVSASLVMMTLSSAYPQDGINFLTLPAILLLGSAIFYLLIRRKLDCAVASLVCSLYLVIYILSPNVSHVLSDIHTVVEYFVLELVLVLGATTYCLIDSQVYEPVRVEAPAESVLKQLLSDSHS